VGDLQVRAFETEVDPIDPVAQEKFVAEVRALMKNSKHTREAAGTIARLQRRKEICIDEIGRWRVQVKDGKHPGLKAEFSESSGGATGTV